MKITYQSTQNQNVVDNERGFRAVFGMGILTALSTGAIVSETVIFALSMIAVYQVITAIIGIDPVYVTLNMFSKASRSKHHRLVTN